MKNYIIFLLVGILFLASSSNVFAYDSIYTDLNLSVTPSKVDSGKEITIRFYDVGADYYLLSASCKDSVKFSGKARPDLCNEGEKIYPTGKDVISVMDFYPSVSQNSSSVRLEVTAFEDGDMIEEDSVLFEIENEDHDEDWYDDEDEYEDENEDEDEDEYEDSEKSKNTKSNKTKALSNSEKLELVGSIFGKDSDLYKLVSLLIILEVI